MNMEENYVQCPNYKNHTIDRSRLQFHLTKCRKAHQKTDKHHCPFDTTHLVDEPEINDHVTKCSGRGIFDNHKRKYGAEKPPIEPVEATVVPDDGENWDEADAASYKVDIHLKEDNVLHKLRGAQPAQRRVFRMEQRQKFAKAKP